MACFLVPAAEAGIVKIAEKVVKKNEGEVSEASSGKITLRRKLNWLSGMLGGGSVLLAFEHLWHGEITPFFPFLTAAQDAEATAEMLNEMATTGVGMAVLVTAVWGAMCIAAGSIVKRPEKKKA